ncbi:MAG: methyltransferase domain-containing protein [Phycisphaerae bacterium]|nr:methyltransferase domain-containing protein [Phycisphaerae bacterium]
MRLLQTAASELSWLRFALWRRAKSRLLGVKRLLVRPKVPTSRDGRVYVHLGCGDVAIPGFINVDIRAAPHVHYIHDVTDLSIFSEGYADLIYACHVLEHVRHTAVKHTLWEWRRVLKPGGILRLSVPDFDKIVLIYESCDKDLESILRPLMGGQNYSSNAHHAVFNEAYLIKRLQEVGFKHVRSWDPHEVFHRAFEDWACSPFVVHGQAYPISLNVEAVK